MESKVKQMPQRLHSQIQNISFNQLIKALNPLQVSSWSVKTTLVTKAPM